ncbi:hypothetical protein VNI00_015337 [Paramarasmius palmivorus]|uniref:Carboxypeptidase regulatory-like domain-containing protein n=1 Tax=Paramarasmius palmivorus TaxID=297713 RepID=A0AAW0BMP4_9AGAR
MLPNAFLMLKLSLVALISFKFVGATPTGNVKTPVSLRIEGAKTTIYEGIVFTKGHILPPHPLAPAYTAMVPISTPILGLDRRVSALDDAARKNGFPWDGTYFPKFDDIFITSIGGDTQTDTQFWGILLNYEFPEVGGCQQQTRSFLRLMPFNANAFLKLTGPHVARVNQPITLTVTNGSTGATIEGANIKGVRSDANGQAIITFDHPGLHTVKADKQKAIRSNRLDVTVRP